LHQLLLAAPLKVIDMSLTHTTPLTLLRASDVCRKLKISKTTLYAKLDKTSKYFDPEFPKQIRLGVKSVGWVEQHLDAWISSKLYSA